MVDDPNAELRRFYNGSRSAQFVGALGQCFVLFAVYDLITGDFGLAAMGVVAWLVCSAIAYRLSGGQRNPGYVAASWEGKRSVHLDTAPVGTWEAKITVMCDTLEQRHRGDYRAALAAINVVGEVTPEVRKAYDAACRNPSATSWRHLREVLLRNPLPDHPG